MDYEQKYKEALERAKQFHNKELYAECNGNLVEYIFPELKESEDEKVREWVYNYFHSCFPTWIHPDITCGEILAWLEKQGQKPAWSEADDEEFEIATNVLKDAGQYDSAAWLITLKQRIGE